MLAGSSSLGRIITCRFFPGLTLGVIEAVLTIFAVLLATLNPGVGSGWFEKAEYYLSQLSRQRRLSVILVGLVALALRLSVLPLVPIPQPMAHDEFSYLLAADTFAHGRLTNPTHPMWVHFETFHVIHKPTYCSKFLPGQALFLAFGQVVLGHPFWGVWLSAGLMCSAITWMLQGWLSPAWALVGGILAVLRFGVFSYWATTYWGGAAAAIGGALVLGALPRIKTDQQVKDALLLGLGLALLVITRPWEGLVLSLPVAVLLFGWMMGRNGPACRVALTRIVLPVALLLGLTAAWLAYYGWRTTGTPFRQPYQVHEQTYSVAPLLIWQHPRPEPAYSHWTIRSMHVGDELGAYHLFRSPMGLVTRMYMAGSFFVGPILGLPFLVLVFILPYGLSWHDIGEPVRTLSLFLAVFATGTALASFYNLHYSAPATGLILALILLAMRRIRDSSPRGLFIARAVPVLCILTFAMRVAAGPLQIPITEFETYKWCQGIPRFGRKALEDKLQNVPGNHLVIVHYRSDHKPIPEWVYNSADIDGSKIVWARDLSPGQNQELVDYFANRNLWWLEADELPPQLSPYPSTRFTNTTQFAPAHDSPDLARHD
jgi:hypothetical protein